MSKQTGLNPGKAGPKGALEEAPARKPPSSGARAASALPGKDGAETQLSHEP